MRGKTGVVGHPRRALHGASMRPPLNAGENCATAKYGCAADMLQ